MTLSQTQLICPRCGVMLPADALACSTCGALVYRSQLEQLSAQAMQLEAVDRNAAAEAWRRCLALLPADSQQFQAIQARLNALAMAVAAVSGARPAQAAAWQSGFIKTAGSMVISIIVYAWVIHGQSDSWSLALQFAAGFVLLTLVHEMGHTLANLWYGLRAGPPIFIPFLGAVIVLKDNPPNAKVEAAVGIAGPLFGTIGAVVPLAFYLYNGSPLALLLANFAFFLNLFNLLPVPPMDGGRVTAAVSPGIWVLGVIAMVFIIISDLRAGRSGGEVMMLMLIIALPRIIATLKRRDPGDYYRISRRSSVAFGALYLLLAGFLFAMMYYTGGQMVRHAIG